MTVDRLKALQVLQVTQSFAVYELRDLDKGVTATLYQATGDMFDPKRGQYIRIFFTIDYPDGGVITDITDWMHLNDISFRLHLTRWGRHWFDIHLDRDQLIDYRLRWG